MPRKPLTRDIYDRLLAAFREAPGNIHHASTYAGVERRMAQRGWSEGWAQYKWAATPIKDVLEREMREQAHHAKVERERIRRERALDREREAQERIELQKNRTQLLKASRGGLASLISAQGKLAPAIGKVADALRVDLENGLLDMPAARKMQVILQYMRIDLGIKDSHLKHLQAENLNDERPTEIVGVVDMSMTDAVREIEEAKALLDLARKQGLLGDEGLGVIDAEEGGGSNGANGGGTDEPVQH